MKRKTRIERVVEIAQVCVFCAGEEGLSAYQIAFWIGLKPSGHLYKLLDSAVTQGILSYNKVTHRPGLKKKVYSATRRGAMMAIAHNTDDIFRTLKPEDRIQLRGTEAGQ